MLLDFYGGANSRSGCIPNRSEEDQIWGEEIYIVPLVAGGVPHRQHQEPERDTDVMSSHRTSA